METFVEKIGEIVFNVTNCGPSDLRIKTKRIAYTRFRAYSYIFYKILKVENVEREQYTNECEKLDLLRKIRVPEFEQLSHNDYERIIEFFEDLSNSVAKALHAERQRKVNTQIMMMGIEKDINAVREGITKLEIEKRFDDKMNEMKTVIERLENTEGGKLALEMAAAYQNNFCKPILNNLLEKYNLPTITGDTLREGYTNLRTILHEPALEIIDAIVEFCNLQDRSNGNLVAQECYEHMKIYIH